MRLPFHFFSGIPQVAAPKILQVLEPVIPTLYPPPSLLTLPPNHSEILSETRGRFSSDHFSNLGQCKAITLVWSNLMHKIVNQS